MNGLKYIREKSNFTQNALAERIGVTRQTVTQWESGIRKPASNHLKWLSDFYGVSENWFGEIAEEDVAVLDQMVMYRHVEAGKEFYTFIPEEGVKYYMHIHCGEMEAMWDKRYAKAIKSSKEALRKVDRTFYLEKGKDKYLWDRVYTAERGVKHVERFLDLKNCVDKVGVNEATYYKVPLRYEFYAGVYAMLIASGQVSLEEIEQKYPEDFWHEGDDERCLYVDTDFMNTLAELMREHWLKYREKNTPPHRRKTVD